MHNNQFLKLSSLKTTLYPFNVITNQLTED